ncbi:threonine/serine exporter ThrE family protein [Mitsuokella sp. AF21-1AC]|uniref:threonine/serine ThrE exporter family protein n=1 Tax=Mitsuokella sp. AF21-1AC TaxID=2292235 RepID=UPI000E4C824A|nr:threonine/serine exporter family protein [Mitsuokella sp. AF21-1AC]RGS70999.1 threonine/serine exporter family protein [Mitsuokella sp. AF21-1AC]
MKHDKPLQEQQTAAPDQTVLTRPYAEISAKLHLLLHTGQLLMESGADSDRTVRDMMRVAAYMGIPEDRVHQHIMYTTLMLNINDETHSYTEFRKCKKHGINMTALSAVSKLTWRALAKNYTLEEFEQQLMAIKNRPRNYPFWLTALGAGAACGGFCKLFGGSWLDFFLTALCAFLGFYVKRLCTSYGFNIYAVIAITSFATTMLAWSTQFLTGTMNWYPLIACTLFLVPGIPLINAVDDLLNNFIVSGMTRAMNTLLVVGSMTFGIVIAIRLGNVADFTSVSLQPDTIYFSQAIAAAISSMGFSIIFNIPRRLLPVVAVGGIITVLLRNICVMQFGLSQAAGSFLGAAVVGLIALKAIHWFHTPNIILTIPSAIPMIPGVLLYRLLFAILNIQTITPSMLLDGLRSGILAIIIIIGIAIGVAIPNIFIHRYIEHNKQRTVEDLLARRYTSE